MVMFGMLLGLGMLIDGAIVVTEYADRKMTEGYNAQRAYILPPTHVLAGYRLHCHHLGRIPTANVLARGLGQVHAFFTGHGFHRALWQPALCPNFRSSHRLYIWQSRYRGQTRPT